MGGGVNLSLNEVESLAKRAARGGGYSWGLAEEAGKAVRSVCVHGLDGVGQLAALLQTSFAESIDKHRPQPDAAVNIWKSSEPLCPLVTGAYLSDSAAVLRNKTLEIREVFSPGLLLHFVNNVALRNSQILAIECDAMTAITDGECVEIVSLSSSAVSDVQIFAAASIAVPGVVQNRAMAQTQYVKVLEHYAQLTYAPATEESRLLGAGTSLSDND